MHFLVEAVKVVARRGVAFLEATPAPKFLFIGPVTILRKKNLLNLLFREWKMERCALVDIANTLEEAIVDFESKADASVAVGVMTP